MATFSAFGRGRARATGKVCGLGKEFGLLKKNHVLNLHIIGSVVELLDPQLRRNLFRFDRSGEL